MNELSWRYRIFQEEKIVPESYCPKTIRLMGTVGSGRGFPGCQLTLDKSFKISRNLSKFIYQLAHLLFSLGGQKKTALVVNFCSVVWYSRIYLYMYIKWYDFPPHSSSTYSIFLLGTGWLPQRPRHQSGNPGSVLNYSSPNGGRRRS